MYPQIPSVSNPKFQSVGSLFVFFNTVEVSGFPTFLYKLYFILEVQNNRKYVNGHLWKKCLAWAVSPLMNGIWTEIYLIEELVSISLYRVRIYHWLLEMNFWTAENILVLFCKGRMFRIINKNIYKALFFSLVKRWFGKVHLVFPLRRSPAVELEWLNKEIRTVYRTVYFVFWAWRHRWHICCRQ